MRSFFNLILATVFMMSLFACGSDDNGKDSLFEEPEMIYVKGGMLGINNHDIYSNVKVSSFNISKYEITQGQWEAVMGTTQREQMESAGRDRLYGEGYNYPIHYVNCWEAQEFCNKLNTLTGKNYRLPTKEEWEYAARGGEKRKGYTYSGNDNIDKVAWYNINSKGVTHKVGTKRSNELGIHDMTGNVSEWCSDSYVDFNPFDVRYVCGGGWGDNILNCRIANSYHLTGIYKREGNLGFRVVLP
ncbi:MAG: formylglycine-generating enzyme family protein [Culturomica sp.]|jgi:formylglycine-generating enzyme required for sulfatase activity|nr:formylglycine-generating enzyme family protein [Culturomica sp.]